LLVEDDKSKLAKKKGVELILLVDVLPVDKFAPDVNVQTCRCAARRRSPMDGWDWTLVLMLSCSSRLH
jgi:hypothetical protein